MIRGRRRLVAAIFALFLLPGVALTASPVGAHPALGSPRDSTGPAASEETSRTTPSASSFRLKNQATGKCLEVWAGVWSGAATYVTDCSSSSTQVWTMNGNQIENSVPGFCLDLYNWNNFDGAPVLVWSCTGAANQYWHWYGNQIRSGSSYRCLTVYPNSPTIGPLVVTASCTGAPNQSWTAVS